MGRTAATAPETSNEPTPESMIGELPEHWKGGWSTVSIPVPTTIKRAAGPVSHWWVESFDTKGHNETFFVPTAYWVKVKGRTLESTSEQWQRSAISNTFTSWKNKKEFKEARSKWKLVCVSR